MEGYLLLYSDDDEVHVDLISEEHYKRIDEALSIEKNARLTLYDDPCEVAFRTEPLKRWFTQTYCTDPWPYDKVKILGTISIPRF
ncbi:MAG: hypothetical protein A2V66_01815 [Ignavibacteria bacterium RBG_13_36_8]|nr:MAG: hypothetical protein A2V66_01815 [Ignavibacteria bacterium RBG_13_36_8]